MAKQIEYYGNPNKQKTVQVIQEPDGLTFAAFESGAECYYDDYYEALDALAKAGYTDLIRDLTEKEKVPT